MRWGWGAYANVRPIRWLPGTPCALRDPVGVDYIIVRESTEDLYVGIEGPISSLIEADLNLETLPERNGVVRRYPVRVSSGRYGLKIVTEQVARLVAHFAAALAERRRVAGYAGCVTIGGKFNANPLTDGYFREIAEDVFSKYSNMDSNALLIDDLAQRMVVAPQEFDVVLLPNLFGDVLSGVASGTIGGPGLAPSGGYGDDRAYFEPAHGSAPDLLGSGRINPVATILSACMLLEYLNLDEAAASLRSAVGRVIVRGAALTPDLGGSATTMDLATDVIAEWRHG
jgi:isocitrate/isopropylmalate dehydrogenase